MSLILFPQERSSENLAHIILPLAVGLCVVVSSDPASWITTLPSVLILVSVGALMLYVFAPADISLKNVLRGQLDKHGGDLLRDAFRQWEKKILDHDASTEELKTATTTTISNAVSNSSMRRRIQRIQVLIYFMCAYWFYFYASLEMALRFLKLSHILIADVLIFMSGLVVFLIMPFVLYPGRRVYGNHLLRDVSFVSEYLYITNCFMRRPHSSEELSPELWRINEDRKYCEELLLRDDMDSFTMMWSAITKIAHTIAMPSWRSKQKRNSTLHENFKTDAPEEPSTQQKV